jgi:hypothetical protein
LELALNLVWLTLAGVSLVRWGVLALLLPDRRRGFAACVALLCVIVVLFPVISASDDVGNTPAVCETSKLKKWVSAELADALASSAFVPRPAPAIDAGRAATLNAPVYPSSRETAWSTLDRRPPP